MARITPLESDNVPQQVRKAFEKFASPREGNISNLYATLAHSPLASEIYLQWYPLYEKVQALVGDRAAALYGYSVSYAYNCQLWSTFFRRLLIQLGDKPEALVLNDHEKKLMNFGSAIATHKGCINDYVYGDLARYHNREEMVVLIAFAGQTIATSIFSNVTETDLDDCLLDFVPAKFHV